MHVALDFEIQFGETQPRTLLEISTICKLPNPQLVKTFLQQHSFLFHTRCKPRRHGVRILTYSAPLQLRNFFFNPGRCRHLYSVPVIIGKCWEAIKYVFKMRPTSSKSPNFAFGLRSFFGPNQDCQISGASLMFSESIRNRTDVDNMLRFLGFLCRVPWDTCFGSDESELCTVAIAQWVCSGLVSWTSNQTNITSN